MKHSQFINSLILKQLIPERHSFGAIKDTNVVENVVWHQHRETEIIYMERAYGTFFLGDSLISFDSNEEDDSSIIIVMGSLLAHSFFYRSSTTLERPKKSNVISVFFHADTLGEGFFDVPEMGNVKRMLEKTSCAYAVKKEAVKKIAPLMEKLCISEGVSRITCLLDILNEISNPINMKQVTGAPVTSKNTENDLLSDIIRYIHSAYPKDLPLSETARRYNMSVSTFCSFFKKYTGQTFVEFLNRLRISKACEKLLSGNDDITSIAFSCGFNNLSNFNRRFKQFKKESPRSYRSRYRVSD